ncbi:N-acetylglucosamine kinase [Rhodobacteraceae bacterium RKSG542]|uniref:BadF/BadG/BcrA/BcrD ATPase family protein n=1 Tax=Pseudovibrio flavus TaxID=2529854 RepID=UPI0012BD09E9|nr:BadF/BadG/BcrA/BcrD ATPase family protein [Pseudovibrio flavus]MTI19094.1 N-acetylglucosamine kinase [Pseudovibrio flavus]
MTFLLGIDGGGTSCKAVLATSDGAVLSEAKAGASNLNTDREQALSSIMAACAAAFEAASLPFEPEKITNAVLGMAGANVLGSLEDFGAALPFQSCEIVTDARIALEGAHAGEDGIIAIIGTGSAILAKRNGEMKHLGGWGFKLGDQASGAWLGHNALKETLLAYDCLAGSSALTEEILLRFNREPDSIIAFAQKAAPSDFGSFAPALLDAAKQNDPLANKLLDEGTQYLEAAFSRLMSEKKLPIALLGGLSHIYMERLSPEFQALVTAPKTNALRGALLMAQKNAGARA